MGDKHPTDIVTDEGWWRIHRGHNLSREVLIADLERVHGEMPEGFELAALEEWFVYKPRIKHCDAFGCDSEGVDFHAHWLPVRPGNPHAAFTLTRWKRATS